MNRATGQHTVIQNYSQKNTATWTPSSYGSYQIKAYIKRSSSPYEYDAYTTYNVTFEKEQEQPEEIDTTIDSITLDKTDVYAGKPCLLPQLKPPAKINRFISFGSESSLQMVMSWKVIQNYSDKNLSLIQ